MERIQQLGPERFLEAIGPVEGPYAFVYFQAAEKRLWYGRDSLGRRSLLSCDADGPFAFALASNAPPPVSDSKRDWQEVDCGAIHAYSLASWPAQVSHAAPLCTCLCCCETDDAPFLSARILCPFLSVIRKLARPTRTSSGFTPLYIH